MVTPVSVPGMALLHMRVVTPGRPRRRAARTPGPCPAAAGPAGFHRRPAPR